MKIGMVTACYRPVINGVTRMITLYREKLAALGHDVTIFTLGEPPPEGDEPWVVRSPGIPLGDTGYYLGFGYSKQAQARLRQMDVLHCHHLMMSVEMAYRYGQGPIVYTNHTRYDLYTGSYSPLPQPAADRIMRSIWPELTDLCDVVIAPSPGVAEVMRQFGVRRPIEVIENGIDLHPFQQPHDPLTPPALGLPPQGPALIYVGRLAPEKNLRLLMSQFAIVRERMPASSLILVGDGPLQATLQQQAADLGVAAAVHFAGAVPFDAVPRYLAAADIFVTPSVSEVHPVSVIEAMAAGLPVVGVRSPGVADLVQDGETGLLTDYPAGGLAAAVVALGVDREKCRHLATQARQTSHRYDVTHTVRRTLDLYERLCRDFPGPTRERHPRGAFRLSQSLTNQIEQLGQLLLGGRS